MQCINRRFEIVALCLLTGALWACGDDDSSPGDASTGVDAGAADTDAGNVVGDAGEDPPDGGSPTGGVVQSILAGTFRPLPDFAGSPVIGRAQLLRMVNGETIAQLHASGLEANTDYAAHVHALPCQYQAGGHYKIDPTIDVTEETNEIWPAFSTDEDGIGRASVTVAHLARGDALSMVVHDPATGDKMACADLAAADVGDVTASGTFAAFAGAEAVDQTIGGTARMVRQDRSTEVSIELTGLDPTAAYASHVHALPCDVNAAGAHYKIDPTVTDTVEANELWPTIANFDDGQADDTFTARHVARADAQSIVVHRRLPDGSAPKVACANLVREEWPDLETSGDSVLFDEAISRGLRRLRATVTMVRSLSGDTRVELDASGLAEDQEYPAHVHNLPCDVQDGGGHYKIDPSVADTLQANEIWLSFTSDAGGDGQMETVVSHTARPEAQAVVIHDAADGARLACVDLN